MKNFIYPRHVIFQLLAALCIVNNCSYLEAVAPAQSRAVNGNWPGFLGPCRNGKSEEIGIADSWPSEGLPVEWQTAIGSGHAAPVVSEGRVFHFSRFGDVVRLTCFDAISGTILWSSEYGTDYVDKMGFDNGPRATPQVDGPRVYTLGAEGVLRCLRVSDGQVEWQVDTNKEFNVVRNFFGAGSSPLIWKDLLLLGIGGSPAGGPDDIFAAVKDIQPNHAAIVALDKLTGKVRWQAGNELSSYSSPVMAYYAERPVLFYFARGGLLAIDPVGAKELAHFPWRAKQFHSVNAATPIVLEDEVFISEAYGPGGALVRFLGDSFEEVWSDRKRRRERVMANHWMNCIEHRGYLYGTSGYEPSELELRCVEWATGKVMWSTSEINRASLLLVDEKLICLSEDGTIRMVRSTPDHYEKIAEWKPVMADGSPMIKYPAFTAAALARGLLYVQGADRLLCLRLIADK